MTWVNFQEIRARVSLEDVLFDFYSFPNLTRDGAKVVGPCPIHNGDGTRSFQADLTKRVWHCFACKRGGNQLDLVAAKEGISIRDAALRLQTHFLANGDGRGLVDAPTSAAPTQGAMAIGADREAPKDEGDGGAPRKNPRLDLRLTLNAGHPHLLDERRLTKETVATFGVGYAATGTLRGQIAIPIHDEDGALVAYAGRRLKEEEIKEHGKYKFPKGFIRDVVVYNFHRAREVMGERGLIVVEGFFTAIALHERGFPNTVATMGVAVSNHQQALLAKAPRVFILFDGDDAGRRGGRDLAAALRDRTTVHLIEIPAGSEPEDLSPKALRWALNGARELGLSKLSFTTI